MAEQHTDLVGHSQVAGDSLAVDSNLAEADIGQEGSCVGLQYCALGCSTGPCRPCHPWEVHWVEVLHQLQDIQVGVETAIA